MTSRRSRLFLAILRHGHLLRFRLRRTAAFSFESSLEDFRRHADRTPKLFGKLPKDLKVYPLYLDGLEAEWIRFSSERPDQAILYFHGGGYVCGSCRGHRIHVTKVVRESGIPALLFGYRLAPENPFPAALDDAVASYDHLLSEGIDPARIVFAGDSAGGGLALATLLALKDSGRPMPAAAVGFSPWTDLTCSGESYTANLSVEALAPTESWTVFSHYYRNGQDPENPLISPKFGDLSGLPPVLLFVGGHEVMLSDSVDFIEKARASGSPAAIRIGEKLFHCYPLCSPLFPEAVEAFKEACGFLREHIKE